MKGPIEQWTKTAAALVQLKANISSKGVELKTTISSLVPFQFLTCGPYVRSSQLLAKCLTKLSLIDNLPLRFTDACLCSLENHTPLGRRTTEKITNLLGCRKKDGMIIAILSSSAIGPEVRNANSITNWSGSTCASFGVKEKMKRDSNDYWTVFNPLIPFPAG